MLIKLLKKLMLQKFGWLLIVMVEKRFIVYRLSFKQLFIVQFSDNYVFGCSLSKNLKFIKQVVCF